MSGDGWRRKCCPAHRLTFILQEERSTILQKISAVFSLTKNSSSSGILLVLCNKELKNLEFGISVASSFLFSFPPFLVTKFRKVPSEEGNLAFRIRICLCSTSSSHLHINPHIARAVGKLSQ